MTTEDQNNLSAQMQTAIDKLRTAVHRQYPNATFRVARAQDDPDSVHLVATVDIDDPDEVVDLVIDRVLDYQLEQGLPVHVIPVRPLTRVLEEQTSQKPMVRPRIDWAAAVRHP